MNIPWLFSASNTQLQSTINQSTDTFQHIVSTFFNMQSIVILVSSVIVAIILGRIFSIIMRRVTNVVGMRADKARTFETVNRLRRVETYLILSIALVQTLLIILAIYFWWLLAHPSTSGTSATAIISAATVITLILSGAVSAPLRDYAFGVGMLAEHWFGIGDYISIDAIPNAQGVVERVTLRSTRIRTVSGQILWITNQNISAARIAPRGVITMALELYVTDIAQGVRLIDETNLRLPTGPLAVVSDFQVMTQQEIADKLWHITAVAETAAGREWFLNDFAVQIIKDLDQKAKERTLVHDPIARYADSEAERRFARTIKNAGKARRRAIKQAAPDATAKKS